MLEKPELLKEAYREPAVTAYNRLESRPRAHDFTRSLRAEVRDAMWLLTRQWQLGELTAEDAGSPIDARLVTRKLTVDRVKLGAGAPVPYDDNVPLEASVERETVPFSHALRVQAAQFFLRMHSPAMRAKYLPRYLQKYAFPQNAEADFRGQVDGLNLYLATRRTCFDGEQVLIDIAAGTFIGKVPIDGGDLPTMQPVIDNFAGWRERMYLQPTAAAPAVWDNSRLCYPVQASAPAGNGAQLTLGAPRYEGGRLDWYSFEVEPRAAALALADGAHVAPPPAAEEMSFLPVTANFKGMPNARFWEMEERQVNFGALDAQTTDQLLLVFAELGLVYDNDWQRWSLFNLSNRGELGSYNRQFLLPSAVGATLESPALERVQFARDEMANMVWAVEEVIPDATGRGINGHDAADKTGVLPEPIDDSPAAIRYLLGTTVPENWIPFIPVQRGALSQDIAFQRAAMPKLGVPPRDVIRAKGVLLNEPALPWFINEEEI